MTAMCYRVTTLNKQYKFSSEVVSDMRRPALAKSFAVIGFLFLLTLVSGTAVAGGGYRFACLALWINC